MSLKSSLKHAIIRTGLEAVALSHAGSLWPQAGGRGVIFTLHHVRSERAEAFAPNALLSITPEFLEQAILASRELGLVPVALEDLPRLLADPDDKRRFVAFTLDDGYRNNAEFAAPIFRKHKVPYTIFLAQGFVDRTRSLWWEVAEVLLRKASSLRIDTGTGSEELPLATLAQKFSAFERVSRLIQSIDEDDAVAQIERLTRAHGIEPLGITDELIMNADELRRLAADPLARFGGHTLTHINLRRADEARLRSELAGSINAIERYVGYRPGAFAYPYGYPSAVGDREIKAAAEAGFSIAVTTQPGVLAPSDLDRPTAFHRVSLNGLYQKKRFVKALLSGIPFKLM